MSLVISGMNNFFFHWNWDVYFNKWSRERWVNGSHLNGNGNHSLPKGFSAKWLNFYVAKSAQVTSQRCRLPRLLVFGIFSYIFQTFYWPSLQKILVTDGGNNGRSFSLPLCFQKKLIITNNQVNIIFRMQSLLKKNKLIQADTRFIHVVHYWCRKFVLLYNIFQVFELQGTLLFV